MASMNSYYDEVNAFFRRNPPSEFCERGKKLNSKKVNELDKEIYDKSNGLTEEERQELRVSLQRRLDKDGRDYRGEKSGLKIFRKEYPEIASKRNAVRNAINTSVLAGTPPPIVPTYYNSCRTCSKLLEVDDWLKPVRIKNEMMCPDCHAQKEGNELLTMLKGLEYRIKYDRRGNKLIEFYDPSKSSLDPDYGSF